MLTKEQKELLIDLIDGYFYPRDLIKDYEKFLDSIKWTEFMARSKKLGIL